MALKDIEGLVELEPEDGCFTSSRMRDEYLKSKGLPPHTRKPRQGPIVKRNLPGRKQLIENGGIVTQNDDPVEKIDNQE